MNTIFVQIASYRDPQLLPTLKDLVEKADHPELLRVTVCWQHGDEESVEGLMENGFDVLGYNNTNSTHDCVETEYKGALINFIEVHYEDSQGACWARHYIQQSYNGEKYTLQLDSHHRFVEGWDTKCIDMLESVRSQSAKPLLTAYIPSFDPDNDPAGRVNQPWKMDFDRFIPEGAVFFLPSTIEDAAVRDKPMRARFYSAHFAFADGSFATEVQHDPQYFFHGEEISIAARAFTHGYDLYHPHIVVAWHEYTRKGRTKVWDDHTTEVKKQGKIALDWVERNNLCHRRNRILFGMDGEDPNQIDFGKYGFGTERTLRQYEEYAGISFKYRAVQQFTLDHNEPLWVGGTKDHESPYRTEQQWRDSMVGSHDIRIVFHNSALKDDGKMPDDFDFWYVAAHDADGEIHRKDLVDNEIRQHIFNEWTDYRFIFLANRKPTHYVVWPHRKEAGWGTRMEYPVQL